MLVLTVIERVKNNKTGHLPFCQEMFIWNKLLEDTGIVVKVVLPLTALSLIVN